MANLHLLYKQLFAACNNGVLPTSKLVTCLVNLHAAEKIYMGTESITNWAPTAGGIIRMVASMFRDCAMDHKKMRTCLSKAELL